MYCNILSNSTGYLVILWVISRMNSGTPLRLTRELLLCCCGQRDQSVIYLGVKIKWVLVEQLTLTKFWSFLFCCSSSLKTFTASVWWLQNSPYTSFIFSAFSSENWEKKALSDWRLSVFTGRNVSSTNLLKQHISNLIDKIILRTVRLSSSLSPFL